MKITTDEYSNLDHAYDWFNADLFDGKLPQVLITLQRKANARGYFSPQRFKARKATNEVDELALNPGTFERADEEILSTLVHEMCHVWQEHFGTPGRGRYHNKEWARKMKQIGLYPSSTGEPGGRETGDSVTHFIIKDGPFEKSAKRLLDTGFTFQWASKEQANGSKPATPSKVKYTCPICAMNVWGKPGLNVVCGDCDETLMEG